jgi:hypothetical protein
MKLVSKEFAVYAGERAVKTVAQVAVATITASQVIGIFDVDFVGVISVALLGGLLSVLTSVGFHGSEPVVETGK